MALENTEAAVLKRKIIEKELGMDSVNKEIENTFEGILHQHKQVKYYIAVFFITITGFFTLATFITKDGEISRHDSLLGVGSGIAVFVIGWLLLANLAHRISMLKMIYKHLSFLRNLRVENSTLLKPCKKLYVFPLDKKDISFPNMIKHIPYIFFVINYMLLIAFCYYYIGPHFEEHIVISLLVFIAIFTGLFYPRVCVTYNKHMWASDIANTLAIKKKLEDFWENNYKAKFPKYPKYSILFLLFLISFTIVVISLFGLYSDTKCIVLSLVIFSIFAFTRYYIEKYQIGNKTHSKQQKRSKL